MAVGDSVGKLHDIMAPPAGIERASPGIRGAINLRVLRYNASVQQSYDFLIGMQGYNNTSDVSFGFVWTPTLAPDGSVTWEFAVMRMEDGHDIDAAWVPSYQSVVATQPAALGSLKYSSITLNNAQMDGVQNGEMAAVRIRRSAGGQSGDAELVYPRLELLEA